MKQLFLFRSIGDKEKSASIHPSECIINLDHIESIRCGESEKISLEKEFINFVGALGQRNQSIYWWASALSEKNSLVSHFFIRIYKILFFEQEINRREKENIIVICSDQVILQQIYDNYKNIFVVHYPLSQRIRFFVDGFVRQIKGVLKQIFFCIKEYRQVVFARWKLRKKNKTFLFNNQPMVVIRTWVDQRNYQSGKFKDSYFKNLVEYFNEKKNNVLIFAGILDDYKRNLMCFSKDQEFNIIPVNFFLKGWEIIYCLFIVLFFRPNLYKPVLFRDIDITILTQSELNRDIEHVDFLYACLQFFCCYRLVKNIQCERFIYTFENYSWEKMSIQGLRTASDKIKTVGFQHAFISRNSFKYFPGKGEGKVIPLPDTIATLGQITPEIMQRYGHYPKSIFSPACALRQDYIFKLRQLVRNNDGNIFVPLTITVEDTLKVLNFLIEAGLNKYDKNIYLRFHPVTPLNKVLRQFTHQWPANFIISDTPSMEEELRRCSVVLYTWTTVCLEAIKMGRPVIYIDVNYPLEVDPLFEIRSFKNVCNNPHELISRIEDFLNLEEEAYKRQLDEAQDYVNQYLSSVTKESYNAFAL
ncbi:MAG: hypothetical protein H6755_07240 [Candidatus Omnitrophica bacterium]|nr:hypothetical protein [Candidatus Omnitrophota bacterium]MCB9748186.1 hypothetical protein [Candidatus Omnitrophota bacterium]